MRHNPSFLTVLFAPLVGVLVYLVPILPAGHFDAGYVGLLAVGWLVALGITAVIGLPVGFGVAHLLKRYSLESFATYTAAGAIISGVVPAAVGWFELAVPAAVTGALLGAGYWRFEVKPWTDNA